MHLHRHLLFLTMAFHLGVVMSGRAQRKQRQAEEKLRPYLGRVDPESLCQLLKCHSPVGSWCQVIKEGGIPTPKCVCPKTCPRQGAPVCSVLGKTYSNECLLHKEACHKKRRIGKAHNGACLVSGKECSQEEFGQFPYRLLDWFLLLSRMGERYTPPAPSQRCLTHTQRTQLAQAPNRAPITNNKKSQAIEKKRFVLLDRNRDGTLSRRDLRKLHYKRMPLEHCAQSFFQSCDKNKNKKVTLREWTSCLVNRSERWFQNFMSVKMGSPKLCPVPDNTL